MKTLFNLLLIIVLVVVGVTFHLHNQDTVTVKYYFDIERSVPMSLLLLATLLIGVVLGYLGTLKSVFRARRQLSRSRKEVSKMEQEITNLRSLPIKDSI